MGVRGVYKILSYKCPILPVRKRESLLSSGGFWVAGVYGLAKESCLELEREMELDRETSEGVGSSK